MTTKFHEIQILLIFGLGLQIMIHLIIFATRARDVNIMCITGSAAFGRAVVSTRLTFLVLGAELIHAS